MDPKSIPAFPRAGFSGPKGFGIPEDGMTMRDYFAAKAMQGMCAHPDTWGLDRVGIAAKSYQIADEMLAAR